MSEDDLHFTAAACDLAKHILFARANAYGLLYDWDALPQTAKHLYVQQASDILRANRPIEPPSSLLDATVAMTRAHASKVVGTISPSEPYGRTK